MAKKGRASKIELFYIKNNSSSMSVEEIASDLGRSAAFVKKYLPSTEVAPDGGPVVGDLMARKDDKGVVIMTENASMRADELKKKHNPVVANRKDIVTEIKKNV